jgi:hypothetical protein
MLGVAVRVAEVPVQIVAEFTVTVGAGLTVTVELTGKLEQPPLEYTTE